LDKQGKQTPAGVAENPLAHVVQTDGEEQTIQLAGHPAWHTPLLRL
jgi:hypothetical protein